MKALRVHGEKGERSKSNNQNQGTGEREETRTLTVRGNQGGGDKTMGDWTERKRNGTEPAKASKRGGGKGGSKKKGAQKEFDLNTTTEQN